MIKRNRPRRRKSLETMATCLPQADVPKWPNWIVKWCSFFDETEPQTPEQIKARRYLEIQISKIEMPQMYPGKALALGIFAMWAMVMLFGSIYRIGTDDGTYTQFYTNWCFMMGCITYLFFLFANLDSSGWLLHYFLYGWWWVYFANAGLVFWLVNFILYETPQLVTDEGEKYGYGKVLVVERTIHVFPYVFAIIFVALLKPDFESILSSFPWKKGLRWRFILYLAAIYIMAHFPFLAYISHYDFQKVYSVDYPLWFGVIAIELFGMIHVFVPILFLSPILGVFRRNIYRKRPTHSA